MSNSDKPLFSHHEHALAQAYEECPECSGELTIKHGKKGSFLGCSNYPNCQYTRALVSSESNEERTPDRELVGSECPLCQHILAVKQGRFGLFIGCTNYPSCHHIEEIHHQDDVGIACPQCSAKGCVGELFEKTNRFGKIFYSCDQYPKCKYVLNHQPVLQTCPQCQWSVLIKRKMASGDVLSCPQKKCTYKEKLV